jgi:PAS domain S-box-containing protein
MATDEELDEAPPPPEIEALRRDIERLRATDAPSSALLEALLEHSTHGIIVCDAEGKLVVQNRASERIWAGSASASSVSEWTRYRAFHPDGRPFEPGDWAMARCLATQQPTDAEEIHYQRFDGTYGVLLGSCAPIFGPGQRLDGAVSVFADITRFKRNVEATEQLLSLSEALSRATTPEEVVDATLGPLSRALGAATAALWLAEDGVLVLAHEVGYRPENAKMFARVPVDAALPTPLLDAHRSLEPVLVASRRELETRYPELAALAARDEVSVAALPLIAETRSLGVLVFSFEDRRGFEETSRSFLLLAARQCAQALTRARLFLAERQAKARAAVLFSVTDRISRAADLEGVYAAALEGIERGLDAERASILTFDEAGVMRFVAWRGLSDTYRARVEGHSPWTSDCKDPVPVLVEDVSKEPSLAEFGELFRAEDIGSLGFFPLLDDGRLLGKFMTYFRGPHRFGALELETARTIAGQVAFAIQRRRHEAELEAARTAAEEAAGARENLVAIVSHDLRSPLGAIVTSAALLKRRAEQDADPARVGKPVDAILRSAERMNLLIRDLLDLARFDAGRLVLSTGIEDVRRLVEEAVEMQRPAADARKVSISTSLPEALAAHCDRERVLQVLSNLLGNAVKFSTPGGEVRVSARAGEKAATGEATVAVTVEDDGPGIRTDELPRVFDRYWKGGDSSRGGVGLGLSIVRALVEANGGDVSVDSAPGHGSRFSFTLPAAEMRQRERPAESARVLVVDDDSDARGALADVFEEAGYSVATAANGAEALDALRAGEPPSVILLDLVMPVMNGFEFRRAQRQDPAFAGIPTVVLTGSVEGQTRRSELEGTEILTKPVDIQDLVALAARWRAAGAAGK